MSSPVSIYSEIGANAQIACDSCKSAVPRVKSRRSRRANLVLHQVAR